MKRKTALPFLVIPDNLVEFHGWYVGDVGSPLNRAGDTLEVWDYARDIEYRVTLNVDLAGVAETLQISLEQLVLLAVLKAGTGEGSMPRKVIRLMSREISLEKNSVELHGVIQSSSLSRRLRLECSILLARRPNEPSVISPKLVGSRLWQRHLDMRIEDGGDSRFPIETLSFSTRFSGTPQVNSPWYVDWKKDLYHVEFAGGVRLYINSDIEEFEERVVAGDALTLQTILADLMNQLVSAAINLKDCEDFLIDCAEGSVGAQIRHWIEMAFPGQRVESIRAMHEHMPGRFHAAILACTRMGAEE